MHFELKKSLELLERTPLSLDAMLRNISCDWTSTNEGENTWCVYDVIGHLIHGELTDWIPRMDIILTGNDDRRFVPFDRYAMFENSRGKSLEQLLTEFKLLRQKNIIYLRSKDLKAGDLSKTGIHPAFGEVTLKQLLSTWVVHDLDHIAQIARIMAWQYREEVGPWKEYLRVVGR